MKACNACGTANLDSAIVCTNCGLLLPAPTSPAVNFEQESAPAPPAIPTPPSSRMIICSVCGTTNINGSSYCDECGAVLPESSASHAISQLSPGYSFPLPAAPPPPPITTHAERLCGLCGTIDREDSHFCQTCGTQLSPVTPTVPPPPPPSLASVITSSHSLTQVPDAQTVKLTNPPVTRKTIGEKLKSLSQGLALRYREWFPAGVIGKAPSPFVTGRRYEATLPLIKEFRFVHEPVDGTTSTRFIGRENEMESLAQRILFSKGGSFLVTGYRGVGKTSFVNQVIRTLDQALPWAEEALGKTEIVDIYLNVARPVEPSEIMHHIIRRLRERLIEKGLYRLLDKDLQEELTLAYDRTSVNMARKLAASSEQSYGFNEASIGAEWMKAAVKMGWSSKRSKTENYEMSYLGYDDKAAEHDIIRISRRLADAGYYEPSTGWERDGLIFRPRAPHKVSLKIVFVFDELDKLEEFTAKAAKARKPVIDEILGSLKNLFTTSGVTFVFVAGKDLQERWLDDVGKGDSVYESVFSYDKYLPCLWSDVDAICNTLLADPANLPSYDKQVYEEFKKYLVFKGRGIPRRIIRTFNEFVGWNKEQPVLAFTRQAVRQIRFFASLQDVLTANEKLLFGESHEEVPGTQSDKRRLGVYYLVDWILRQSTSEFTLKDVLNASKRLSAKIALAEEIAPHVAEGIIRILVEADYLQEVEKSVNRVQIEAPDPIRSPNVIAEKRYKIAPRRLGEMVVVAAELEADLPGAPSSSTTYGWAKQATSIGRFRILRLIARGGMGTVYEATDERRGLKVAIKLSLEDAGEELLARFEREALIMGRLNHPNIVRMLEFGRDEGRFYIVMEYLDGITLEGVLNQKGKLSVELAVAIAKPITEAANYVHEQGFVRNDIKPANIVLTAAGRVCLLDFGISRPVNSDPEFANVDTTPGAVIGTPQFMAPEQLRGEVTDRRADIFAFGVMLYRMLTGVYPFEGDSVYRLVQAQLEDVAVPPSHHVKSLPPSIDALVMKCLEKNKENRFQTMKELSVELGNIAEGFPNVDLSLEVNMVAQEAKAVARMDEVVTMQPTFMAYDNPPTMAPAPVPIAAQGHPGTEFSMGTIAPPSVAPPPDPTRYDRTADFVPIDNEPRLTLISGNPKAVVFDITYISSMQLSYPLKSETTIGRASDNAITLRDLAISRYQAAVKYEDGLWFIEDFNTNLGTLVNGEKIISRRQLSSRDEITIGGFVFIFTVGVSRPTNF